MPDSHVPLEVVSAEYRRWSHEARTGRLVLEFLNGRCTLLERNDKLALPVGIGPLPISPCCTLAMEWSDYNQVGRCKCGTAWNVFEAARRWKQSHDGTAR